MKQMVLGTPTRIDGNKAIFVHGDTTDVYNTDRYIVGVDLAREQPEQDTFSWISQACDGDNRLSVYATVEVAVMYFTTFWDSSWDFKFAE